MLAAFDQHGSPITVTGENTIDFFEPCFGIAPDGGNGMFEAAYVVCLTMVVLMAVIYGRRALAGLNRK